MGKENVLPRSEKPGASVAEDFSSKDQERAELFGVLEDLHGRLEASVDQECEKTLHLAPNESEALSLAIEVTQSAIRENRALERVHSEKLRPHRNHRIEPSNDPRVERVRELSDLISRFRYYQGRRPRFSLSDEALDLVLYGLQALPWHWEHLDRWNQALAAFRAAKPTERLKAFARELGFNPSTQEVRQVYDDRYLVFSYITGLWTSLPATRPGGKTELTVPLVAMSDRRKSVLISAEAPRDAHEVLSAVAELYGFPSKEACRAHLIRLRKKARNAKSGWLSEIKLDEFKIPFPK